MNTSGAMAVNSAKDTASEILEISLEDFLNEDGFNIFISVIRRKSSQERINLSLKSIYKNLNIINEAELHCFIGSEESIIEDTVEEINKVFNEIKRFSFNVKTRQVLTRAFSLYKDLKSIDEKLKFCITDFIASEYFAKKLDELEFEKEEIYAELLRVKQIASGQGTKELSSFFRAEANALGRLSLLWFMGIVLSLILCLVQVYIFDSGFDIEELKGESDNLISYYFLHKLTLKVFALGICASFFYWSGKNYMTLRHLVTVNKERENILKTFLKFSESTTSSILKNIAMREAVRSVFSPSLSGYISQKDRPSGNQRIARVLKKQDDRHDKE